MFRYYVPAGRKRYGAGTDPRGRFKADVFDDAILASVEFFVPPGDRDKPALGRLRSVRRLITRIEIGEEEMTITLRGGAVLVTEVAGRVKVIKPQRAAKAA